MADFQEGDIVQLKSGGPKMTVGGYMSGTSSSVSCTWFVKETPQHKYFNEKALKKVEDDATQ